MSVQELREDWASEGEPFSKPATIAEASHKWLHSHSARLPCAAS